MSHLTITHKITIVATTQADYDDMLAYVSDKYASFTIEGDVPNLTIVITSIGEADVADYEGL